MKINLTTKSVPAPLAGIFEKYSVFILPFVSGLIILALLLFVVRPRLGEIFELRGQVAKAREDAVVLENKLSTLQNFDQDKLLSDVKKVETALPSDKDLQGLLSTLERLAAETGVGISAVQLTPGQISPIPAGGAAENFPVKVTITGNFFQIKSHLARVFESIRVIGVKSLTITLGTVGSASLSATLNLDSFFQQLAATQVQVREPLQNLTSAEQQILDKILVPQPTTVTPPPPPITGKADPFAAF